MIPLRPYQRAAIDEMTERHARGAKRILLVAPTGAGKTVLAGHVIERAARAGQRVLFLAHRRELINQAYGKLLEFGLPPASVGVIMASDARRRPGAVVQVASVDTLRQRARPLADLVFVDECHRALAQTYRSIAEDYPDALHLGLTATPYRADGRGLGDAYDELVVVATPRQLIDEGFLVEPKVFTVPLERRPKLGGVRIARGDYAAGELDAAMNQASLVGDIIDHWRTHAGGVRTVAFAVSIRHSQAIAERFRAAGISAEHLDGTMAVAERDAILGRLDRGETRVVVNMGVLCEGWDQPSVKCAILARPTKSTGLYLQQAGRILRPWQGHPAVILDHAGCALEHGLPQDDRVFSLHDAKKKRARSGDAEGIPVRVCPECSAVLPLPTRVCPACGTSLVAAHDVPTEESGTLVEMSSAPLRVARATRVSVFERVQQAARAGGRLSWDDFVEG